MRGIRGMNLPKLMKEDIPLFEGLFQDLFPGVELIDNDRVIGGVTPRCARSWGSGHNGWGERAHNKYAF